MIDIICSKDGLECGECPIIKECEHIELTEEIDTYSLYEKGRTDAIDELETELIDIILGNEEFTDWQKQEISSCLECVIEQLKEQN